MNRLFLKGVKHGLPIGLGYLSVAFTFGMKAVSDGLTPLQALLISLTNVTSAGQFAGLPLMIAQASLIETALTQLIINIRYALMSLSLSQRMHKDMNTPRRMFFSFMNTDMKAQILINARLRRTEDMRQAHFLSRNTYTRHSQPFSLQMFIIIMEQLFQQFFLRYSLHGSTSYLFVMLQTTYPRESRK